MFIYHEGMPGSGKSYEALVEWIVPTLANTEKGRHVYAYVEGLNHAQIAELANITFEDCQARLHQVEREQVPKIYEVAEDNSLVIIDELQNFFPSGRQALKGEITQFVTEHRHRGIDIVGLGQNLNDVHNLWKRRCQRKIIFQKQDVIGRADHYFWASYNGTPGAAGAVKFVKVRSGSKKYEPKYFGSYASVVSDDTSTENLRDDRTNVLKKPTVMYGLPIVLLLCMYGVYYTVSFFQGESFEENYQEQATEADLPATEFASTERTQIPIDPTMAPVVAPVVEQSDPLSLRDMLDDTFTSLLDNARLRYSGTILSTDAVPQILIELIDNDTLATVMRFTEDELRTFGYNAIVLTPSTVAIRGAERIHIATSFELPDNRDAQSSIELGSNPFATQ